MIPVRLKISGFLSYHDQVDLDFNAFDLACISGSNGAGKSSLLDAITWVLFGEARRRDDSIINHQSTSAEVIFDFDYENSRYRVHRSKTKDKSTFLEFYIQDPDGMWKAHTEATLRATEERIRQTLRLDYETFTNASFFLQGKADQFAQQRPGDRKRILANILGLEIWETYKDETVKRRKGVEMELASIEGILSEIEEELKEETERKKRLSALEQEYKVKKELADTKKSLLDQQRLIADRWEKEKQQLEKQSNEIRRLHTELDNQVEELRNRQEDRKNFTIQIENADAITKEFELWQKNRKTLEDMEEIAVHFRDFDKRRQKPLLEIETEKTAIQTEISGLLSRQAEIDAAKNGLSALSLQIEEYLQSVKVLTGQLEMRPILEKDLRELAAEKGRVKAENAALKTEMDELINRISALQDVKESVCPTCEKPLNAVERHRLMEELNLRGKEKGDSHRENQKIAEHCDNQFREKETQLYALQRIEADLKLQQRNFDLKSEELVKTQKDIDVWTKIGLVRLNELQEKLRSENYALDARMEFTILNDSLKRLGYDMTAHENAKKKESDTRGSQEKWNSLQQAKAAMGQLEREISNLEKSIDKAEVHLSESELEFNQANQQFLDSNKDASDLNLSEREYYTIQEDVNRVLTEVGYARNQVDVLDKLRKQKAARTEEKGLNNQQIANLKVLEKAFGKDGIPALLIEQALPEIESHANDILDRLSSGGMSVKFETQREFKDKKRDDRKETLDILIRDGAGEREYELFSGGEAFRVNFAIRLALSRVLARRSGARLQTLVIDEGFGSQDADGRQRLIEAINLVRGDFAKILVITHLEELKDAFSARVEVTKTPSGSQVNVVAG